EFDGAGGLIDFVVDGGEHPGRKFDGHGAIEGVDGQLLSRALPGVDSRQLVFGDGEDDANGLELCDDQETRGIAGLDVVAGIHQAQAYAAGYGRSDVAVHDIDFDCLNKPLVVFDNSFVRFDGGDLGGELLLGDGVLFDQGFITRLIDARILECGLVALELAFVLCELGFVGPRIDLRQQIALVHDVALFVVHGDQLAIDLGFDGDGVDGRDGAEPGDIYADVALEGFCRVHRGCAARSFASPAAASTGSGVGWRGFFRPVVIAACSE